MNGEFVVSRATRQRILISALVAGVAFSGSAMAQQQRQRPAAAPAAAQPEPKPLGNFDAWTSVELGPAATRTCYMFAKPASSAPSGARRGDIMLVVTHRPANKRQDEVSFQSGYPFKEAAPVAIDIDGKKFDFFTRIDVDPETAWARDDAADKAIVAAMRAGKALKVSGTSSRNTLTTDTFSLTGFSRAYAEIGKACGVK